MYTDIHSSFQTIKVLSVLKTSNVKLEYLQLLVAAALLQRQCQHQYMTYLVTKDHSTMIHTPQ